MRRADGWHHMHSPIGPRLFNSVYMPVFTKKLEAGEKSLKLPRFLWAKSFLDTQLDAIP